MKTGNHPEKTKKKGLEIANTAIVFVLCLFLINTTMAKTWQTVGNGFWNSSSVWLGDVAPGYTSSDTFLIKHPVILDSTLTLNSGAYLEIDSMGGLCGHVKMTLNPNTKMIKYGILELDTLSVSGGTVYCLNPGLVILTLYGYISDGGHLIVNCPLAVGPWFDCHLPEYAFAMGLPTTSFAPEFSVFPNPFSSSTTLQTNVFLNNATIIIYNSMGQAEKEIKNISGHTVTLFRDNLSCGLHFLRLTDGNNHFSTHKLILTD